MLKARISLGLRNADNTSAFQMTKNHDRICNNFVFWFYRYKNLSVSLIKSILIRTWRQITQNMFPDKKV